MGNNRASKKVERDQADWIVREQNHPAIVSVELFEQCQQRKSKGRAASGVRTFSGLLQCGSCGSTLHGDTDGSGHSVYICSKRRNGCERFSVRESVVLPEVLRVLRVEYFDKFTPDTIAHVEELMKRQLAEPQNDVTFAKRDLEKIEAKLFKAQENLALCAPDMRKHIEAAIRRFEEQRAAVLPRTKEKSPSKEAGLFRERIQGALNWLNQIEELANTEYEPEVMRGALIQFVDSIKLEMVREPVGKTRHVTKITGGTIYLRTMGAVGLFHDVGAGADQPPHQPPTYSRGPRRVSPEKTLGNW